MAAIKAKGIQPHTAIVCYLRKTAELISEALGLPAVTGDIPAHKRADVLAGTDSAVVTMMAINEGIDLRKFTNVIVAESYPVPRFVEQVIGRFVRLFAAEPVTVSFLRLSGTSDVVISERLVDRLQEQAAVAASGKLRQGIENTLRMNYESDTFLESLKDQLTSSSWEETDDGW